MVLDTQQEFMHLGDLDAATAQRVADAVTAACQRDQVNAADLLAVSGSFAYGLAHADSDVDVRGVYREPLARLLGLEGAPKKPVSSKVSDTVVYELGVLFRLALGANPNVLELFGLEVYERKTPVGTELLAHRQLFFSQKARTTYAGFAQSQLHEARKHFQRLAAGDTSVEKRARKHLRHSFRVLEQGVTLLAEGVLEVRLDDPARVAGYSHLGWEEAEAKFATMLERLDSVASPLPVEPDWDAVNDLLLQLRRHDPSF